MYLGVVAQPVLEFGFDGKVHLERLSKEKSLQQTKQNQNFSDVIEINTQLKQGDWRYVATNDMDIKTLIEVVGEEFMLDEEIIERLEFSYFTYDANGKRKQNHLRPDFEES